jgi:hypothetical protein
MEQGPFWEANRFAASQEIPRILWNPKAHSRIHKCPPSVPVYFLPIRMKYPAQHPFLKISANILRETKFDTQTHAHTPSWSRFTYFNRLVFVTEPDTWTYWAQYQNVTCNNFFWVVLRYTTVTHFQMKLLRHTKLLNSDNGHLRKSKWFYSCLYSWHLRAWWLQMIMSSQGRSGHFSDLEV